MVTRTAFSVLFFACLPNGAAGVWQPPLTDAHTVRVLDSSEAAKQLPVQLTGVVTHINEREGDFWFQGGNSGIYVSPSAFGLGLVRGDRVEVRGVTQRGAISACVKPTRVTRLGAAGLPEPIPYNLAIEGSRSLEGQHVKGWAEVLNARSVGGTTRIDVRNQYGQAVLFLKGEDWVLPARELRNHMVVFTGVCVPTSLGGKCCTTPKIYISELPKCESLASAEQELVEPITTIESLRNATSHPAIRRVKIAGVVVATPLPNLLVIQDQTGGACVWTEQVTDFPIGMRVHALGLARLDGRRIAIFSAYVKSLGIGALPIPAETSAEELASGARDSVMVKFAGRLEEMHVVDGWTSVTLKEDGLRYEAYLHSLPHENGLSAIEVGSRVSVVGVPADVTPDRKPVITPSMFLISGESVALLEPPAPPQQGFASRSWWTSARAGYMIGGFATVLFLGCGWLLALRVQVRRAAGEAKRQFEAKVVLEQQLHQAAELQAVGRLAGGIAHDFNNLLTVINGCAELLAEETSTNGGRLAGLTDDIRKAGERAASLTGQLLTFSRKRDILISAVSLNDVVTDTVRLLDRVIGEDIRIEMNLQGGLPAVHGEQSLLHQVMMNLAVNAKDAMPQGGVLSFTTSLVTENGPSSDGWSMQSRNFVRLTIADSGIGMSDEVKARLFEPYFTTKAIGSGTGLGLATVLGSIQTLRGQIQVDSAVGCGTRFHIDLRVHGEPVSDAEIAMPMPDTPLPPSRSANVAKLIGKTILVVEDNEMVRQTLLAGLEGEGATVLSADRPETALQLLASHDGPVDVLVTDVVMPGMSGPALAERVRESRPAVHIVFISGYTADEVLRRGVLEEQVDFIQKPFTPDHLIRRLQRVLARGSQSAGAEAS